MVKGLGRAGLKGLKLASASGGLEGAAYGATGSDSVDELPENVAWGTAFGAALPVGLHGVGKGARYVAKPFSSRLMTAGMVDSSLTSRINVPETIAAERARYGDYMTRHGADEVMDFAPTREQLLNYPAESRFNLPKKTLTSSKAENIFVTERKIVVLRLEGILTII